MRITLALAACFLIPLLPDAKTASCGAAPQIEYLDTLANGGIVYRESGRVDTSYPGDLRRAVDSLLDRENHVAVGGVQGICRDPVWGTFCMPGTCDFTVTIDTVLKGAADLRPFRHAVTFGCGWDNSDWYLEGRRFLIWSDSVPYRRPTATGPCYSHPRGFFVEDGHIVSPMTAMGQRLPLASLKRRTVGLGARPRLPALGVFAWPGSYRVDGRWTDLTPQSK